jgi:Domain of unknown function (DUF4410)
MRRRRYWYVVLVTFCLLLSACSNIRTEDERELHAMPPAAPSMIYVKDFDLEPGTFQAESGILPLSPISAAGFIPRILGVPEDSAIRQRELMKLMSSALVDDLIRAGLDARFLPSGELLPREGWLVRGAFVQIDEGNRLKRALIGFGSGATRLRIVVWISDLGHGSSGPFCALDTSTHSSRKPGAALSFDPYVGAARFVIDGFDLDTNVIQIAAQIADDISERSRTGRPPDSWKSRLRRVL